MACCVTIAGHQVGSTTATALQAKALVGYVRQDVALYPDLTARENLRFFARLYRLHGRALQTRVDEVLELIGLTDRAKDRVESFSGACAVGSTSAPGSCTGRRSWCSTSRRSGWRRRAGTRPRRGSSLSAPPAWQCGPLAILAEFAVALLVLASLRLHRSRAS